MITLSLILAWLVCGIIALVGGGVVGMALANLLNPKRRSHNYVAWRVFTGKSGWGDVFIIKHAMLAAKFQAVLDGKLFFHRGPGKGKHKKQVVFLDGVLGEKEVTHEKSLGADVGYKY